MNKRIPQILIILLLLSLTHAPSATAADKISVDFPLEVGDSVYFEDGYYKVQLISTEWQLKWALVNVSCEGCLYGPREMYGRANESVYYPSKDKDEISITDTREVTKDSARITIVFPDYWSYKIVSAEEIEKESKPVTVPKLVVSKSVDKTRVKVDELVQVKITVRNTGNGTAKSIDITEIPSTSLIPLGETLKPKIKDPLPSGESDFDTYFVQAVKPGTFTLPTTSVTYYSESDEEYTAESNIVTVTVLAPEVKLANLTTTVQFDRTNILKGEEITATILLRNVGDAPAKSITLINKLPPGLELVNGELENTYFEIKPDETRELNAVIRAKETGNYTLEPRTVYSDGETTITSPTISVTQKVTDYKKYSYLLPIGLILILIIVFIIKRHKEYSF